MKKFSFVFVVMALAMFAFILTASAQQYDLATAIDEALAEPFLGTWYIEKMCFSGECMDLSGLSTGTLTLNADGTAVVENEDYSEIAIWYIDEGLGYLVTIDEEAEAEAEMLYIDDDGSLFMGDEDMSFTYVRELAPVIGTGALKTNATVKDFAGEWVLNGMMFEGSVISTSMFDLTGKLTVEDSALSLVLMDEATGMIPFELKDGKLYTTIKEPDETGKEVEINFIFEYHEDNCIHMIESGAAEGSMIFVREADIATAASTDTAEAGAESELSEAELLALLTELSSNSEAEGEISGDYDLSSLLGNLDLQAILQSEKVKELLSNPELQGLLSGLQDENGNFSLDGIMNSLGGMLSSGENGESGLSVDGLLQGLGGLFGGSEGFGF